MKKGISFQGYVALRLEPDHSSEMISQILFGEEFSIKDEHHEWALISLDYDASEGWLVKESIQVQEAIETKDNSAETSHCLVSYPSITALDLKTGQQVFLPAGSYWPSSSETKVVLGDRYFEVLSKEGLQLPSADVDLEETGKRLISIPYIRGGRCGFGFDGPGFVQMLCKLKGLTVPRTSSSMAELGNSINFMHEVKAGDLAFFDSQDGEIDHVGLLLEGGRILHAFHQVRIDRFDQQGIYCAERDKYTHKLRIIKRIEN